MKPEETLKLMEEKFLKLVEDIDTIINYFKDKKMVPPRDLPQEIASAIVDAVEEYGKYLCCQSDEGIDHHETDYLHS